MLTLTVYGGVGGQGPDAGEIGGNKNLLKWDERAYLLDFGTRFPIAGGYYEEFLRPRKGPKIARVALARKLVTQLYWMRRRNEPYDALTRRLQATGVSSPCRMA